MYILLILLHLFIQDENDIGLDLNEVIKLASTSKNVTEFEEKLNSQDSDNNLNNVDLNNDGFIDYISVTESRTGSFSKGKITYTLDVDDNTIASIDFEYPDEVKNNTRIVLIGHSRHFGPKAHFKHRVHFGYHGFWTRSYWNRKVYRSPYRYNKTKKRVYPKNWKKKRVINRKLTTKKRVNRKLNNKVRKQKAKRNKNGKNN